MIQENTFGKVIPTDIGIVEIDEQDLGGALDFGGLVGAGHAVAFGVEDGADFGEAAEGVAHGVEGFEFFRIFLSGHPQIRTQP